MLKIYGFSTFNVTKVLLTAEEIGLDYEYVAMNPTSGELKVPEHLRRHPLGKVPALEHDGRYLFESAAICRYLARISDSPLYSGDAWALGQIDAWIDMAGLHIGRWLTQIAFTEVVLHRLMGQALNQAAVDEAGQWLDKQLPPLEQQLGNQPYVVGDRLTLADIILASYIQVHEVTSFEITGWPNIQRWFEGIRQRPSMTRALQHFPNGALFGG